MSHGAEARIATANARRYASQLGKHWSHSLAVEEDGDGCRITFPRNARGADWPGDAIVTLTAGENELLCRIEASAAGQLDGLKGALERHIDRFAFREAPLDYHWQDLPR